MEIEFQQDSINFQGQLPTVLCCICATAMQPNPSGMCVQCLRSRVDITEGIPKQIIIHWCRGCGRYLQPPSQYIMAELESKELLTFCLKRVKGLTKVRLVDAGFIWTEPHSKRLKVKLTVQQEVHASVLQQEFVIEFIVQNQQCEGCQRVEAKDTWQAVVQVRQKITHKRTFYFLEQLILKHNAHVHTINIKERADGLDFFYNNVSHATKMVDFVQSCVPIRYKTSKRLIGADLSNNTFNNKYTFSAQIVPICREDLVCLPLSLAKSLGNINPLVLVSKISNCLHLLDPFSLQSGEVSVNSYFSTPFRTVANLLQAVEYVVLDVTPLPQFQNYKYMLGDFEVAKISDFGVNDKTSFVRSHLANILNPGDHVIGYDLTTLNGNDDDLEPLKNSKYQLPDCILIRKHVVRNRAHRHWKLKSLTKETEDMKLSEQETQYQNQNYEIFLRDMEENSDLRSQINVFKEENAEQILAHNIQVANQEGLDDTDIVYSEIPIEELMQDLSIDG